MENNIFLSDSGLTSTSAQHIKDMAGHLVDNAKSKLNSINFVTEDVTLIGNNTQHSSPYIPLPLCCCMLFL